MHVAFHASFIHQEHQRTSEGSFLVVTDMMGALSSAGILRGVDWVMMLMTRTY